MSSNEVNHVHVSNETKNVQEEEQLASRDRMFSIEWEKQEHTQKDEKELVETAKKALLKFIRENVIGDSEVFHSPYGYRKITYCDYTASGRSLAFIEDYIRKEVLPLYANTHTTTSVTGLQSTLFRYEARQIISNAVNAGKKDVLIFGGSGSTALLNKLVHALGIKKNDPRNPVVFVGPFEHHSNLLPWRESGAIIVNIKTDEEGNVDLSHLENELKKYKDSELKIGAFSAASNITGVLTDTNKVAAILHKHGAYAVFDYAAAAPYVKIDMNPVIDGPDRELVYKDAIVFSPHKFIGGVETPGVLVAKKHMFINKIPEQQGGGTVFFVTDRDHRYLKKTYEREEGGTPSIVGSIRTGLVFQLKKAIGEETIHKLEQNLVKRAIESLSKNPNIQILGNTKIPRVAIISFMIRHHQSYLHYNYVSVLLNDLFGIQCRGGCMCAGPYALSLLDIDYNLAKKFEKELLEDDIHEYLRPGFTRINFNYFTDEETFNYILDAIHFVANEGWKLLPHYTFIPETGEWMHYDNKKFKRKWLGDINYQNGKMEYRKAVNQYVTTKEYKKYMKEAYEILNKAVEEFKKETFSRPEQTNLFANNEAPKLRWFVYPFEALAEIRGQNISIPPAPFQVKQWGSKDAKEEDIQTIEEPKEHKEEDKEEENKEIESQEEFILPNLDEPTEEKEEKPAKNLWRKVPYKTIMKPVVEALNDFDMIKDGDRLLLALSGGKDSLSLLHILKEVQRKGKVKFEIGACTVDPQTEAYDPAPLKIYLKQLGVPYFFESQNIIETAKECQASSICSWCSRMKRGILYNTARREGYNVLVMGQHLDDLAESFLMSVFHNGFIRTMKANYVIDKGDLRVIRPMVYVRERELKRFAKENKLPVINENCPACFDMPQTRQRVKTILTSQEHLFPDLYNSILTAIKPLMHKDLELMKKQENRKKFKTNDTNLWTPEKAAIDPPKGKSLEEVKRFWEEQKRKKILETLKDVDTELLEEELKKRKKEEGIEEEKKENIVEKKEGIEEKKESLVENKVLSPWWNIAIAGGAAIVGGVVSYAFLKMRE